MNLYIKTIAKIYPSAKSLLGIILVLGTGACKPHVDLAENAEIPDASWDMNKAIRFEYFCQDTLNDKDILFNIRHSGQYPYSNLFLFVNTLAPNGRSQKDTVEFMLADARGKWFGSGIGDIYSLRLIFKRNIRFAQEGRYIFYIQHGMREKTLTGITDLGILIKNTDKKND
ncbi:MAG: gliding motility lipoprotein GldH [Bacteroidales bacterium]|nr:gliding motility lipoprotein GldH [Bacteroidales bacterium]